MHVFLFKQYQITELQTRTEKVNKKLQKVER